MTTTNESAASPVRPKGILSRITGRWWQILVLWLVVSVPLLSVVSLSVQNRYEAWSLLRVAPVQQEVYEPQEPEPVDPKFIEPYLQTQVTLLASDRVLHKALLDPRVISLSTITQSDDPNATVRQNMTVELVKDTFLIRVAMELADGNQAAAIVNAVVASYLEYNGEYNRGENSKLRTSLLVQRELYQREIKERRAELKAIIDKGIVDAAGPRLSPNESGKETDPTRSILSAVTKEQLHQIAAELVKIDLDHIKAQSLLDAKQSTVQGDNDVQSRQTLNDLRLNIAGLVKQKEYLAKYLARLKINTQEKTNDRSDAEFVNRQLDLLLKNCDQLDTAIKDLEFKASREDYRVCQVDPAEAPGTPVVNNRLRSMIAGPMLVLLLLIGFCLLLPIRDVPAQPAP